MPVLYGSACAIAASRLGNDLPSQRDRIRAAIAFPVMHIAWGTGFLAGRASSISRASGIRGSRGSAVP